MIVMIDGYNLLKQVFHHTKGRLEIKRTDLISQLGLYKKKQYPSIKEIILVFDGGEFKHAIREIHSGVVVIFSGQRDSADEWIINFINKNKQKELLLVTRDRELIELCNKIAHNFDVVDPCDFHVLLQRVLLDSSGDGVKDSEGVRKYENELDDNMTVDREGLDLLMSQADVDLYISDRDIIEKRAEKDKKLSKEEKRHHTKIRKLT